jgi:hypothetical protein
MHTIVDGHSPCIFYRTDAASIRRVTARSKIHSRGAVVLKIKKSQLLFDDPCKASGSSRAESAAQRLISSP